MKNKDLLTDSMEFAATVLTLRPNTKEKWAWIGNYCKEMAYKYPNLAYDYNQQVSEARREWLKLDKIEKNLENNLTNT